MENKENNPIINNQGDETVGTAQVNEKVDIAQANENVEPSKDGTAKKPKKKKLWMLAVLLLNICALLVILLVELNSGNERAHISTVLGEWGKNWYFLLMLVALVVVYYLVMTLKYYVLIKATTNRFRFKLSFSTAVLGKYYDNITPMGSGGQPFQMLNLKRKLGVGECASIPIADFLVTQFTFAAICIFLFIINGSALENETLRISGYIGIVFYMFIPILAVLCSAFPKFTFWMLMGLVKLGHKMRIIKDVDKMAAKIENALNSYSKSLKLTFTRWWSPILVTLGNIVMWWVLNSIPYFVLRACGVSVDYFDTVCLSFFVYAAVAVIPTPGNAGAAEGAFYVIFQRLSGPFLFWGTLLWRFCVYYSSLFVGFCVTIYQYIHGINKEKRAARLAASQSDENTNQTQTDGNCEQQEIGEQDKNETNNL